MTFIFVGKTESQTLEAIRQKFAENSFFWLSRRPADNEPLNGFGTHAPQVAGGAADRWLKIGPALVEAAATDALPTDDWPFLYLRQPSIPALNVRSLVMVALLSLAILWLFAPPRALRLNGQMFFLGAGFMLIETKSVVHMSLLFGATWVVNSIVFAAILVMILLGNLFVLAFRPRRLWPFYALLFAALAVNAYVPMHYFLDLPGSAKIVGSCALVFGPIFFAGVIFGTAFRLSPRPDVDFGSNIAGIILGGLSEYFSPVVGFNHLLLIAVAFYVLSALLKPRLAPLAGPSNA